MHMALKSLSESRLGLCILSAAGHTIEMNLRALAMNSCIWGTTKRAIADADEGFPTGSRGAVAQL